MLQLFIAIKMSLIKKQLSNVNVPIKCSVKIKSTRTMPLTRPMVSNWPMVSVYGLRCNNMTPPLTYDQCSDNCRKLVICCLYLIYSFASKQESSKPHLLNIVPKYIYVNLRCKTYG